MSRKYPEIAKITHPVLTDIFPRKRLFQHLDIIRKNPVVWISGPPGCGKTTLVASYLDYSLIPHIWYRADEGDSDVATFFYYMSLAAKKAAPVRKKPLPLLTPEYLKGLSIFTMRYFENLFSRLRTPFIIVLDNYQSISAESNFHEALYEGLRIIPEKINIFIISRRDPPAQFVRLWANNKMGFLGWNEIRFSIDETKEMIETKDLKGLTEEMFLQLHKKTDGWAAGLILMLKTKMRDIDFQPMDRLAPEEIFEYFAREIFVRTDKKTKDFLLRTAFLPYMTNMIAEKFTGIKTSGEILSNLARNHYFTEKSFHTNPVYRYHPLFREYLQSFAKASIPPTMISKIEKNAAKLLEENGEIEDALRLLLDAMVWDELVRLILVQAGSLIAQGRHKTLEELILRIPEETTKNRPYLSYWLGLCKKPFHPDESQLLFEEAFRKFKALGDSTGSFLAWSGIVESIVYSCESLKSLDPWFSVLDEILKKFKKFPTEEIEACVTCSLLRGLSFRRPAYYNTESWAERAFVSAGKNTNTALKTEILINLACYHYSGIELQKLEIVLDSLRELVRHIDLPPLPRLVLSWVEAAYANITSMYDRCLKIVSEGLEFANSTGIHMMDCMLMGHAALCSIKKGNFVTARRYLKEIGTSLNSLKAWEASFYHYIESWDALYSKNLARSSLHSEQCLKLCEGLGNPWTLSLAHLQKVFLSNAYKEDGKIAEHLASARLIGSQSKNDHTLFSCLLAEAYFLMDKGEDEAAVELLREGMRIGQQRGFVNPYMWPPGFMEAITAKALEAGIEVAYVQGLIKKNALLPEYLLAGIEEWPWPVKVYTFGRFGLLKDGKPLQFSKKKQQKPHSMLKALIALGGRDIKEEQLTDLLWPDAEGDAAHSAFTTTLFRLRQLLGIEEAIKCKEGRITLDPRYCWVDAWVFERLVSKAEAGLKRISETESIRKGEDEKSVQVKEIIRLTEKAINLYKGHFLPAEEEYFWTASYRERLRSKFLRLASRSGNYLQKFGQWEKAVEYYQRAIEIDDLTEDFYQNLMLCYQQLDQKAEAIKVYKRCCKVFSAVLGIEPSSKTVAIYKSLL
jgi:LuxR family maltose regulon positive regulatory protein